MRGALSLFTLLVAGCSSISNSNPVPLIDYHQHLVSGAFAPIAKLPERDGRALVRELDAAGIKRAVVLSVAYTFGDERKALSTPDERIRAENDWLAAQVRESGGRLVGFAGVNPLRDAALAELERALSLPGMVGIKLHLGNSGITLRNPDHVQRLRQVFALAQRRKAAVLVHMRSRGGVNYGADDARIFLEQILPMAPGVDVIIAHLGGSGPGYGAQTDEVMSVFALAAQTQDARLGNLYFDVATNVTSETSVEEAAVIARRLRQVGVRRVLYGSDLSPPGGGIREGWEIFRSKIPLTEEEFRTIMSNQRAFVR